MTEEKKVRKPRAPRKPRAAAPKQEVKFDLEAHTKNKLTLRRQREIEGQLGRVNEQLSSLAKERDQLQKELDALS